MEASGFYHTSVLLNEAVDGLAIRKDGVYVDATFGGGGHSRAILERLGPEGRLIAFDHDADAWNNKPDDDRLIAVTENFRYIGRFLRINGYPEVDGILADLGVSSFQFDTGERGFSTRFDGPLDMRMDTRSELTAAEVLKTYKEEALHRVFEQNGEVRNSKQLAKHIVTMRGKANLNNIESLKSMIGPMVRGNTQRYLAQVFQALRIEVNDEFGALQEFLKQSAGSLKPGGRLCVISFHSLEDRIVKRFIKKGHWNVEEAGLLGNEERTEHWDLRAVNPKPIEPAEAEIKLNPRARSARLRIAEKL